MNKYYERPQKEIIGFYCFISDKPKQQLSPENKGRVKFKNPKLWQDTSSVPVQFQTYPQFI